jgi:hypothetical protein
MIIVAVLLVVAALFIGYDGWRLTSVMPKAVRLRRPLLRLMISSHARKEGRGFRIPLFKP